MKKSFVTRALAVAMALFIAMPTFAVTARAEESAHVNDPVYDSMTQPSESMSDYQIKAHRNYGHITGDTKDPRTVGVLSMGALYITSGQKLPDKFTVYLGRITNFAYSKKQDKWIVIDDQPCPRGIYIYTLPWETAKTKKVKITHNEHGTAKVELTAKELEGGCLHFWGKTVPHDNDDYLYYACAYDFWVDSPAVGKLSAAIGIDAKDNTGGGTTSQLFSSRGLSSSTEKKTHWGHTVPVEDYDKYHTSDLNKLFLSTVYEKPADPAPKKDDTATKKDGGSEKVTPVSQSAPEVTEAEKSDENTEKKSATVKATKITSATCNKNTITLKWKKRSSKVDGYQIQYSINKKFKKNSKKVTIKGSKKGSTVLNNLEYGRKYYIRIRTYKKINGKKVYSSWSKKKAVTIPYRNGKYGLRK